MERHESVDGLVRLFSKAKHDLSVVQNRLEKEFQQIYSDGSNPMNLVARIKKIQEELLFLKQQCQELLTAKQELIDQARTTLVSNRSAVQRMQAGLGIPVMNDDEDSAYSNFKEAVDEWAAQVRSKTGDVDRNLKADDINQLLFSAVVHNN